MRYNAHMTRVVHVGLGPLGCRIAGDLVGREGLELVAAVDVDPKLAGRSLSDVLPGVPRGARDVTVGASIEELPDELDAAVVTTVSDLAACAPTLRALLERGLAVVSTCEELCWPWLRHAELARELDALARERGGRLLGTGVNPGFLMDALPVFASSVCRRVDSVEVWRVQDAASRRLPFQRKIGATLDLARFEERRKSGTLRHVGLAESLAFVATSLGLGFDDWEETLEPVIAERDLACDLGPIPRGAAAGVRQVAEARAGGRVVCRLTFQAAIDQADPHDRVKIDGEPPLDLRFSGGVHGDVATCAIVLNAIPALLEAPAGLHTMASIPMAHFGRR